MCCIYSNSSVIGGIVTFINNPNNVIIGFIGALIGGVLSYRGSKNAYEYQLKLEKRNIAKAIDTDLNNISQFPYFYMYYSSYKKDKMNNLEPSKEIDIPDERDKKFYDDKNLLYFVFNHDIAKFDYNLSTEIYEFYNDLFKAEYLRKFVLKNKESNSKPFQELAKLQYGIIRDIIIKCGDDIENIRTKLKEIYES